MDTETQHGLAVRELDAIAKQTSAYVATIDGMEIHDDDELALAGDLYKDLNHWRRKLEEKRTDLVQPLNKVVRDINALFKAPRDKIDVYLGKIKKQMTGYTKRKEELERQKREQEAAEAAEREERLRKAAKQTRDATPDDDSGVAAVLEQQADAAATEAEKIPAKRTGPVRGTRASVSTTKTWKGKVVDGRQVCAAIGAGRLPLDLVNFSQSEIDALARMAEKERTQDGIKFFLDVGATVR